MTGRGGAATVLPRSAEKAPAHRLLSILRPPARLVLRRFGSVEVLESDRMPRTGPVLVVGNHAGVLDGPMMAAFSPRPVHALTKQEMFTGPLAWALRAVGQVKVDRYGVDVAAIRTALRVLREGRVAGVFPEGTRGRGDWSQAFHHGAAYLALVTGAPIVPVTFIGTGPEPGSGSSLPPRGARMVMVYGEPWLVQAQAWPRTRQQVAGTARQLHHHLRAERARALALVTPAVPARTLSDVHASGSEGAA